MPFPHPGHHPYFNHFFFLQQQQQQLEPHFFPQEMAHFPGPGPVYEPHPAHLHHPVVDPGLEQQLSPKCPSVLQPSQPHEGNSPPTNNFTRNMAYHRIDRVRKSSFSERNNNHGFGARSVESSPNQKFVRVFRTSPSPDDEAVGDFGGRRPSLGNKL